MPRRAVFHVMFSPPSPLLMTLASTGGGYRCCSSFNSNVPRRSFILPRRSFILGGPPFRSPSSSGLSVSGRCHQLVAAPLHENTGAICVDHALSSSLANLPDASFVVHSFLSFRWCGLYTCPICVYLKACYRCGHTQRPARPRCFMSCSHNVDAGRHLSPSLTEASAAMHVPPLAHLNGNPCHVQNVAWAYVYPIHDIAILVALGRSCCS
jgi:hypothetical protein